MRWAALILVVIHAGIMLGHDDAHKSLVVELKTWQEMFIYPVIVAAPLIAAALVFSRLARFGFLLLAISMFGSLAFGVFHHYIAISPDHVSHLPPGDAQGLFRLTALAMAGTELAALVVGILGAKNPGAPAASSS